MADIWGDGNVLAVHTSTAGADGSDVSAPPHTLLSGDAGVLGAHPPYTIVGTSVLLDYLIATLPPHTIVASALTGNALDAAISLRPFTLVGDAPGTPDGLEIAVHSADSELLTGFLIQADALLPPHAADDANNYIAAGSVIFVGGDLPAHTIAADFGWMSQLDLPAHTISAVSSLGPYSYGELTLPAYTIETEQQLDLPLESANDLPVYVISASGLTGSVGSAALLIPAHRLTAEGFSGSAMTAANNLPVYVLVAGGTGPYDLTAALTLPIHQLDARLSTAVAAAYRAWALNLKKRALTEYTNYEFNSFAQLGTRVFAASADGIFELGAYTTDAGDPIQWSFRTGKHAFGSLYAKRLPRAYLSGTANGPIEFRTITGADAVRAYLLPWNQSSAAQLRRIPIGRGPKSTYWQFEVLGREGSAAAIDALQFYPERSARRVSGQ